MLPIFFLGTFVISWTLWILAAALQNNPADQVLGVPGLLNLAGAFAPSLMAVTLIGVSEGRRGLREVARRMLIWRVGVGWYMLVLAVPAAIVLAAIQVGWVFGTAAPDFANPPIRMLLAVSETAVPLWVLLLPIFLQQLVFGSAMGEEMGWRGYALPRLQARHSALRASLLLGTIWGLWHVPRLWVQYEGPAGLPFVWFVLGSVLGTVATAIMFTWVWNSTRGSLLLVLLFHAAYSVSGLFLPPAPTTAALSIAWMVAVGAIAAGGPELLSGRRSSPASPPTATDALPRI